MTDPKLPMSADDVETAITIHADAFEQERAKRAKLSEAERVRRARRAERQFRFLFAFFVVVALFYAYRIEVNTNENEQQTYDLAVATYKSCQARVTLATTANQGREVLINLVLTNPARSPESRLVAAQQLRDGLFLPVEDCGAEPVHRD